MSVKRGERLSNHFAVNVNLCQNKVKRQLDPFSGTRWLYNKARHVNHFPLVDDFSSFNGSVSYLELTFLLRTQQNPPKLKEMNLCFFDFWTKKPQNPSFLFLPLMARCRARPWGKCVRRSFMAGFCKHECSESATWCSEKAEDAMSCSFPAYD